MSLRVYLGVGFHELVEADTYIRLTPRSSVETPDHPSEDGYEFQDAVIKKPRTLTAELVFSPLPLRDGLQPSGPSRPEMARRRLMRACNDGEIVRVVVDNDAYHPAVLLSVDAPRSHEDGDARRITLEVKEFTVVESETVKVPTRRFAKGLRHKGKTRDKGTVPTRESESAKATAYEGALRSVTDVLAVLGSQ